MRNPFARELRELRTSLSPGSCRERLRAQVGSIWNPFAVWGHPLRGRVTERGFWVRKTILYRNSFQTEAHGRWFAEGNGTRIEVQLGVSRFVPAFLALWISILLVAWLALAVSPGGSGGATRPEDVWVAHWLPPLMILFGIALLGFGRWLARNESRDLIEFLSRTFECPPDATPIA